MKKSRIAVAGAGYIGVEHIRVAQRSPTCMLSAVIDPSPAAADIAAKAGVPLYGSLDELFALRLHVAKSRRYKNADNAG